MTTMRRIYLPLTTEQLLALRDGRELTDERFDAFAVTDAARAGRPGVDDDEVHEYAASQDAALAAVRVGVGVLEAGAPIREAARNVAAILALAVASLGGVSAERLTIAAWVVLLATYLVDIVLLGRGGVAQARAKRAASSSPTTQGGRRG